MGDMKIVVGLGNPGDEYINTRHNMGFKVIDSVSKSLNIEVKQRKFGGRFGSGEFSDNKLILLKPWQFMNRSGQSVATAVGASVRELGGYPGWKPDVDSDLLATAKGAWRDVHGLEASLAVIHAGLECGIIGAKFSNLDMISIGPTIKHPHSPDEKVHIGSVEKFWDYLKALLAAV